MGTSGVAVTVPENKVETPSVHAHVLYALCLCVNVGRDAKVQKKIVAPDQTHLPLF